MSEVQAVVTAWEVPREPYGALFMRFLRFGCLAWGGPVAQIAMLRQDLVEEEHWISNEQFDRVLAVYQALPGPEAHEMCVYFGMLSRGQWGGLLAGIAFMLPGFILMLALSCFYVIYGIDNLLFAGLFYGFQPAVAALIVRAVHRIGSHAVTNGWLLGIAATTAIAQSLGVNFLIALAVSGLAYVLHRRGQQASAILLGIVVMAGVLIFPPPVQGADSIDTSPSAAAAGDVAPPVLFVSGLKAGLLTFGGAYTVIPFLQHDAVAAGGWMSNERFLDGLALSGILPAPLIIFSTFVGYIGGGWVGAIAMTVGIFLPAFGVTLIGHDFLERLIGHPSLHTFLEGVTAGVVGLITATSITLLLAGVHDVWGVVIFAAALGALFRWKARIAVLIVMLGAGLIGAALMILF